MRQSLIICVTFLWACGGGNTDVTQETKALPEILGGTDSFMVNTLNRKETLLLGKKVRTTYASFANDRQGTLGFIGSTMSRMAENNCQLTGPVHILMLRTPISDTMDFFVGIPSNSSQGFVSNEIYKIPAGQYYAAQVGKASGYALPKHKVLQEFLDDNKYPYQMPIIEVWKEQMERDMSKHENLQLQYRVK